MVHDYGILKENTFTRAFPPRLATACRIVASNAILVLSIIVSDHSVTCQAEFESYFTQIRIARGWNLICMVLPTIPKAKVFPVYAVT